ncbi:MAG: hypothetical protein AB7U73_01255 [Pirellulales bacterium]
MPDLRPTAGGLAALALAKVDTTAARRRTARKPDPQLRERRQAIALRDRAKHLAKTVDDWRREAPERSLDLWTARGIDAADVIECLARRDGPFELTACSYAIGEASLRRIAVLREEGRLTRVVLLCDPLMFSSKRNAPAAAVRQVADELAAVPCHAKVYCLTPSSRRGVGYVVTGSANLTANPRLEVVHLSAAHDVVNFYRTRLCELMAEQHDKEANEGRGNARRNRLGQK